jgi:phosphoglycerate dehydrogenase-like enzyme
MPEIGTVLATVQYEDPQIERLRRAFHPAEFIQVGKNNRKGFLAVVGRVDVAVISGDVDQRLMEAPHLRWVHCDKAGVDGSARPEVLERGLLVTSSSGRSDAALAEHVIHFMLALAYDAPAFHAAQQARRWGVPGQDDLRALSGRTVGILGLGHIGTTVARYCKTFGMRVLGYRRRLAPTPDGVDRVYSVERGEGFLPILEESDFLVLALPLTDATHGMIGAAELARMKPSAFLINIARGALTDETALAEALESGRLAGAGLDVFATEPLPRSSALWRTPRTLITPHVTPRLADRTERSIAIIEENVRRYRAGEALLNLLSERDLYTRGPPPKTRPLRRRWKEIRRGLR